MIIKFNIWDIDREQYFKDVLSLENDKINKWGTLEIRTSNNVEWLQFTGMKDENGVEIYNGDILKREIKLRKDDIPNVFYEKVIFKGASFCTENLIEKDKSAHTLSNYTFHTQEIIGNIYQNKEFLSTI